MKKCTLLSFLLCASLFGAAQNAVNFTCNDCSGNSHDLFSDLNAGKVVVIAWVMPCGSCVAGATAAQTEVQNHPGQALFYLADDVANTSCNTLNNWAATNGITPNASFSNAAVNMSDYGAAGMPKVIVLGGMAHKVYYNENGGAVTQAGIQAALTNALAETGVRESTEEFSSLELRPNPSTGFTEVLVNLSAATKVKVEVQNLVGETVSLLYNGELPPGNHALKCATSELAGGTYFIQCSGEKTRVVRKLQVVH